MTVDMSAPPAGIARREFLAATAGVAAAAVGVGTSNTVLAQAASPAETAPPLPPTKAIVVERLPGGVLTIGINRPEKNLVDAAMLIGLGKAYYQFEHDDELRVAVLYAKGPDFSYGLDGPAYAAAVRAGQYVRKAIPS